MGRKSPSTPVAVLVENNILKLFMWLGFSPNGDVDNEAHGDCPLCGKENKFYLNVVTGLWSCKAGNCQAEGNVYTFISSICSMLEKVQSLDSLEWQLLEKDRGISRYDLKDAGIVYDHRCGRYYIPIHNADGALVNLRIYHIGHKLLNLPGMEAHLFGSETLRGNTADAIVCEGEWDTIALRALLRTSIGEVPDQFRSVRVVGTPGAAVLKSSWIPLLTGRRITLLYDAGVAGDKGTLRAASKLADVAASLAHLVWEPGSKDGYDVRDFYNEHRPLYELISAIHSISAGNASHKTSENEALTARATHAPDANAERPSFKEVVRRYAEHLYMTEDYECAIRVTFAVALSQRIPGDPLWMYIVGPPSSGKTVILQSLSDVDGCILRSTLTAAGLVSGFRTPEGKDPSLIPQLDGKVFVLKDFTEILNAQKQVRDDIYGTLRGAYDGLVEKSFGNGVFRRYEPHFSMLAGVTQAVFAERSASLGERFLMLHIVKGNNYDADDTILRALDNVGKEVEISLDLAQIARDFLEVPLPEDALEQAEYSINLAFNHRLVGLSQLVAMLRGQVERDFRDEKLLYRPQTEVGTRLAKQLKKLGMALALLEDPIEVNDSVYRILARVAFDTVVGFNLEVIEALYIKDEASIQDLHAETEIPITTLRMRLDDLELLGVIERHTIPNQVGRGMPLGIYKLSDRVKKFWEMAGMNEARYRPHFESVKVKYRRK